MAEAPDNYTAYWDSFWGDPDTVGLEFGAASAGERARIEAIAAAVPADVGAILDVGCGGGLITNYLVDQGREVTGMDISSAALTSVRAATVVASTDAIPAPDRSYDLLLVADVLEHLPRGPFEKTLSELDRVANRYLIVNSPDSEQLELARTRCQRCTAAFHSSRHVRSIEVGDLNEWLPNFEVVHVTYTGEPRAFRLRTAQLLAQALGDVWYRPRRAVCPNCGYPVEPPKAQPLVRVVNGVLQRSAGALMPKRPSEFVALLRRA